MTNDDEVRALRAELERVKRERDTYRRSLQYALAELHPPDPERLEAEIRAVEKNGTPFVQFLEELKTRFGTSHE